MKVVLQRVKSAYVTVDSSIISEISIIGQQTTRVADFIGDDLKTYFAFAAVATGVSLGEGWHSFTYSIDTPMGKKDIQRQRSVPAPTCDRSFYCTKFSFFAFIFSGNYLTGCALVPCRSPWWTLPM